MARPDKVLPQVRKVRLMRTANCIIMSFHVDFHQVQLSMPSCIGFCRRSHNANAALNLKHVTSHVCCSAAARSTVH